MQLVFMQEFYYSGQKDKKSEEILIFYFGQKTKFSGNKNQEEKSLENVRREKKKAPDAGNFKGGNPDQAPAKEESSRACDKLVSQFAQSDKSYSEIKSIQDLIHLLVLVRMYLIPSEFF